VFIAKTGVFSARLERVCNPEVAKMVCVTFTVCYLAVCNNLITPEWVSWNAIMANFTSVCNIIIWVKLEQYRTQGHGQHLERRSLCIYRSEKLFRTKPVDENHIFYWDKQEIANAPTPSRSATMRDFQTHYGAHHVSYSKSVNRGSYQAVKRPKGRNWSQSLPMLMCVELYIISTISPFGMMFN